MDKIITKGVELRILIDTNVFIYSETRRIVDDDISSLMSLVQTHQITCLIHPSSIEEIEKDRDVNRREITLSKVKKYPVLNEIDTAPEDFINNLEPAKTPQDIVDNQLLYSLSKNAVDFLITEDNGIHRKADGLELADRVLTVKQAIIFFKRRFERYVPDHVLLENIEIHNLDLDSEFFDSLREDYPSFDTWFVKKSKEGRKCWCWRGNDKELRALLIYAEKNKQICRDIKEPSLKMCTFKVDDEYRGMKIGELLLKMCFSYCTRNSFNCLYCTIFKKQKSLRTLLKDFGFNYIGNKQNTGEMKYAKDFVSPKFIPGSDPFEYCKRFFPHYYDGEEVEKFIIPIRPEYHDRIFPDANQRQTSLNEYIEMVVEQNTIKKAYLSGSRTTKIERGDVILFYRSKRNQGITGIGVVESTLRHPTSFKDLISFIGPRSVYTEEELKDYLDQGVLAILFRYIGQLPNMIPSKKILEQKAIKGPPQSITKIDNQNYKKILKVINDG